MKEGGTDAEIEEWIFARGLRPNRTQVFVWNGLSRKLGWNDRVTAYLHKLKSEPSAEGAAAATSVDLIEYLEGRTVPPLRRA